MLNTLTGLGIYVDCILPSLHTCFIKYYQPRCICDLAQGHRYRGIKREKCANLRFTPRPPLQQHSGIIKEIGRQRQTEHRRPSNHSHPGRGGKSRSNRQSYRNPTLIKSPSTQPTYAGDPRFGRRRKGLDRLPTEHRFLPERPNSFSRSRKTSISFRGSIYTF